MRARRTDRNHGEIAGYFERLGCLVHHTIGDWDLTISRMKVVKLVECKGHKGKFTDKQVLLLAEGWPIRRCETLEDVIGVVNEIHDEALHREKL